MSRVILRFRNTAGDVLLGHASGPWRWVAVCSLAGSIAAVSSVAWQAVIVRSELSIGRDELAAARARHASASSRPSAVSPATRQRTQVLNRAIRQLNTPWSNILDALEEQASADVALVSIEPDSGKGSVRIEAEARQLEDLLKYAHQLGASPQFTRVVLVRHEQNEREAARPFRMSLDVSLRPRSPTTEVPSS